MTMSKGPFRFEDPRHKDVHRRLLLVGPGPASFYKDACRMMAGSELQSVTHFVGHSLREIESSLRDVLESVGQGETRRKRKGKKSGKQNHLDEIHAILEALEIDENDPVAEMWIRLAKQDNLYALHRLAHRSALFQPRKLDAEFRKFWDDFNLVLDLILDRFESRYLESHRILDELLAKSPPTEADVKALCTRVPNNAVSFRYFFDKLQDPAWLPLLNKEGLFRNPVEPDRDIDAGTVSYPPWPQSRYLAKMATLASVSVKKEVYGIALVIEDKGNLSIQSDLLDIALALPPEMAAEFTPKAKEWVKGPSLVLPDQLTALMLHLAREGHLERALDLGTAVFAVEIERQEPISLPNEDGEDALYEPLPTVRSWLNLWAFKEALKKLLPELIEIGQETTLQWISDVLDSAIDMSTQSEEKDDRSHMWRPAIEDHEQNSEMDVRDPLVSAVRDAALKLVELVPEQLLPVIGHLESRQWSVFHRIALHLLTVHSDVAIAAVGERLTREDLFNGRNERHEYVNLLSLAFSKLNPEQQTVIFKYVEQGPPHLNYAKARHREEIGEEMSTEAVERYIRRWQRDRLAPISTVLPKGWKERYQASVDEFGEAEHPDFLSYTSGGFVGPTSPKTADDLRSMDVSEIVKLLRSWQPPDNAQTRFELPSREGFSRVLSDIVKENPVQFAERATEFTELDATYVRGLFSGLSGAAKHNSAFTWKPVIDLAAWAIAQPVEIQRRASDNWLDSDPSWAWTRKEIAGLLALGLEEGPCVIPIELRSEVWNIIRPLTEDQEPTAAYEEEYGGTNMDPATLAINTVRGQAINAAVRYGLWVRRSIENLPDGNERIDRGFDEFPELREVLELHLDPQIDSSVAIRSVYGRWFPWLVLLDVNWTKSHLRNIFPGQSSLRVFRNAAWQTYVIFCRPYDDVVDVLKEEYHKAVERIGEDQDDWGHLGRYDEHLAEHILIFFGRGQIGLEIGGLLERFYTKASDELRSHSIGFVGRMLSQWDDVPPDWIDRFKDLWAQRVESAESGPDSHRKELAQFGWWFASGKFEDAWALRALEQALAIAHTAKPDHMVLERLATVCAEHPVEAVTSLRMIAEGAEEPWSIYAWRKEIREILATTIQSTDQVARRVAIELINRLAARGHTEFRDLL